MKILFTIVFACCLTVGNAQLKLSDKDLNNLVALANLYTNNINARGEDFVKAADALRTPALNHVIEALIATGKGDTTILQKRFLARPPHDELMLWYVLREVHYNSTDTTKKHRSEIDVAKDVLNSTIDENWLLDNYYYRIHGGMASVFNTEDLSHYNIVPGDLGFKNDTETAIFFLNTIEALVGGRFLVLQRLKKNDRVMEFARKLPMFNGKPYYYYTNLDFPDFEWIGYGKKESYKKRHIGGVINTLFIQFACITATGDKPAARELYFASILHKPEYFKYTALQDDLQAIYDKSKP